VIQIRPASGEDRGKIVALFAKIFGNARAMEIDRLWEWQWELDPRLSRPGYRGVVAEWQGEIIGSIAAIPAGLHVRGEPVEASWIAHSMVHWGGYRAALRAQRAGGAARARSRAATGGSRGGIAGLLLDHPSLDPIHMGKHISRAMMVVTQRKGYRVVDGSGYRMRTLSVGGRCARALGRTLGRPCGLILDLLLPRIPRPRAVIRLLEGDFGPEFDRLWEAVRDQYILIGLRDARTLSWRYRRRPDSQYRVLVLHEEERLRGYSVLHMFRRRGCWRGKIVDLLSERDDHMARGDLLAASLRELRDRGADSAECYATHEALISALEDMGFRPRSGDVSMVIGGTDAEPAYVTGGDGDGN
jgi:hypothetical protein